jgi:hypothetical protein
MPPGIRTSPTVARNYALKLAKVITSVLKGEIKAKQYTPWRYRGWGWVSLNFAVSTRN